jgi:CRP/FNR family cyclic AMP-dependent transcriptional regulator
MVDQVETIQVLATIPWFVDLTPRQKETLAQISGFRSLEPGETLFCEGDREDCLYVLLEGQLSVEMKVPTRGQVQFLIAEPLDVLGWSTLTPVVRQRTATVRALQPSRLLAVEGEALRDLCELDHDLGYLIMRRLANIVASRLLTTRLLLLDVILQTSHEISQNQVMY